MSLSSTTHRKFSLRLLLNRFNLNYRRRENLWFVILVFPNLLLLAIWTFWPFIHSLYLSFTDWNLLTPTWNIVGFENYLKLLRTPLFWQVTRNSMLFGIGTVAVGLPLALGLALLLNQPLYLRSLWRFIFFSPHITTTAAMALVWKAMYDPDFGIFNTLFAFFGGKFPDVLGDTRYVLPALAVVAIWKSLGFSTVVFLAALQGVDTTLKEAAAIDGANSRQIFRYVVFPSITPITYFLLVIGIVGAIRTFDVVSVMTGGGPANASNMFVYQIYTEAFTNLRMGVASALAGIMLLIILVITAVQTRLRERWVNY